MSTQVVVGVRITKEAGLSFFGVDEVNAALKAGKRVTALESEGALFQHIGIKGDVAHCWSRLILREFERVKKSGLRRAANQI